MSIKHLDPGKNASSVVAVLVTVAGPGTECFLSSARRRGGHSICCCIWRERGTPRHEGICQKCHGWNQSGPFGWVPTQFRTLLKLIRLPPGGYLAVSPFRLWLLLLILSIPGLSQPVPWRSSLQSNSSTNFLSYDRRLGSKMERFSWQLQIFNHESNLI